VVSYTTIRLAELSCWLGAVAAGIKKPPGLVWAGRSIDVSGVLKSGDLPG
jgi:hypothetical protein